MSVESTKLIDNKLTPWEAEGTERELGSRDWLPNEEPPSANFDYEFYWMHKTMQNLLAAIDANLVPQRFYAEQIDLNGANAAEFGYVEDATGGKMAVLSFAAAEDQECQLRTRVRNSNSLDTPIKTKVEIEWSSTGNVTKTAVWQVKYFVVGDGETFQATPDTVEVQASDSSIVHGRVRTTIELPVLAQGKTLVLRVVHHGTNGNDEMESVCCVHSVAVV